MNNTTRDVGHIVKFNGQIFPLWKFGFWILLEQHDLVKIVNGEEALPAEALVEQVVTNRASIAAWHTWLCLKKKQTGAGLMLQIKSARHNIVFKTG
ncbi:hypothetical protein DAPPUDRAFT_328780 [Daphnia pulex]|uniref:Uncharacterized protein n=1 Tax=Daphnia pulex TaxID=6669 RepID=E9HER8_DAPPU|nr:hypothetical protein DAPPUDRAFT_328780 [Daphnia pulex]|eukprot:EFX69717.1 hypothetical protein DAPPUDRAFT_328780 [Daphnia pulex]